MLFVDIRMIKYEMTLIVRKEIDEIMTEVFGEQTMGFSSNSIESTTDPFESNDTMSSQGSASSHDYECSKDFSPISDSDDSVSALELQEINEFESDPTSH